VQNRWYSSSLSNNSTRGPQDNDEMAGRVDLSKVTCEILNGES
jgi:hypothetical protein